MSGNSNTPALDARRWQTILFVPADREHMLRKAQRLGADAILIDLEDAIPPAHKEDARETLRTILAETGGLKGPSALCVRTNAPDHGLADDIAALTESVAAIVLPKVNAAEDLDRAKETIGEHFERPIPVIPQIESVQGVLELRELTARPGLAAVAFGGEDFSVDLGVTRSEDSLELLLPRALLALHARAADLPAIDTIYADITDTAGLIREARTARQLGFSGKLLIHPSQITPVSRTFAPTAEELTWALEVQSAIADSSAEAGVHLVAGKMVDAPVIAQAERILARERRQ